LAYLNKPFGIFGPSAPGNPVLQHDDLIRAFNEFVSGKECDTQATQRSKIRDQIASWKVEGLWRQLTSTRVSWGIMWGNHCTRSWHTGWETLKYSFSGATTQHRIANDPLVHRLRHLHPKTSRWSHCFFSPKKASLWCVNYITAAIESINLTVIRQIVACPTKLPKKFPWSFHARSRTESVVWEAEECRKLKLLQAKMTF